MAEVAQVRKFKIEYRDEQILRDGRAVSTMRPFGTMTEDEAGARTMELAAYPNTTFFITEETK